MNVQLSWTEVAVAARIGETRYMRALAAGRVPAHGIPRAEAWGAHIEGACAELAAAKGLGVYWPMTIEPDHGGDLGLGIHVRSSPRADACLILHDTDADGLYYLVVGETARWRVAGSARVPEARDRGYWRFDVRSPAYFIPQDDLAQPKGTPDG